MIPRPSLAPTIRPSLRPHHGSRMGPILAPRRRSRSPHQRANEAWDDPGAGWPAGQEGQNAWGWKQDQWRSEQGWSKDRWSKKWDEDKSSSKPADGPAVLYPQAYISDIPVEFDDRTVRRMHQECGVQPDEIVSVKFLPSKDSTGETCSCIVRYHKEETFELVVNTMHGKQLKTKSGKIKAVGVSKARPARWMVQAGLAQEEPKETASKWTPWLEEGVVYEGTVIQWYPKSNEGFLKSVDGGVDLYAQTGYFANLGWGESPMLGTPVRFQALWNADRARYEAREIYTAQLADEAPELPDGPAIPTPEIPFKFEKHPGLDYFAQTWSLNKAMVRWLQHLHPDVQEALINDYDDSTVPEQFPGEEVVLHPSSAVAVAGLYRSITKEVLHGFFSRFGTVKSCRFLGATAVVEMADEEEAQLAVQDVQLSDDWQGALVVYYYHQTPPMSLADLPLGQRLFGIVKKWDAQSGSGWIAVNGTGPDIPVRRDALEDVAALVAGAPVLFKVKWRHRDLCVECCMGDRDTVRERICASFGRNVAVWLWAKSLEIQWNEQPHGGWASPAT